MFGSLRKNIWLCIRRFCLKDRPFAMNSDETGIECPHCNKWNTHEECGTYEVLNPFCVYCGESTEVGDFEEE